MYTYMHIQTHSHTHSHTHIYIHTRSHPHIHTLTHTRHKAEGRLAEQKEGMSGVGGRKEGKGKNVDRIRHWKGQGRSTEGQGIYKKHVAMGEGELG